MNLKQASNKICTVVITDFTIHGSKATNPKPLSRQVESSVKSGKPGRAYAPKFWMTKDGLLRFVFPNVMSDSTKIKYVILKKGIKIILAPDLVDKIRLLNNN